MHSYHVRTAKPGPAAHTHIVCGRNERQCGLGGCRALGIWICESSGPQAESARTFVGLASHGGAVSQCARTKTSRCGTPEPLVLRDRNTYIGSGEYAAHVYCGLSKCTSVCGLLNITPYPCACHVGLCVRVTAGMGMCICECSCSCRRVGQCHCHVMCCTYARDHKCLCCWCHRCRPGVHGDAATD